MALQKFQAREPLQAAFTEEQKTALRTRILPDLDRTLKPWNSNSSTSPAAEYVTRSALFIKTRIGTRYSPLGKKIMDGLRSLNVISDLVRAICANQSPERRAAELKQNLKDANYRTVPLTKLLEAATKNLVSIPNGALLPAGKELQDWLKSPDMALLRKSWSFIVEECAREFEQILKQNGFQLPKKKLVDRAEQVKRVLPGWTFSVDTYGNHTGVSPDGLFSLVVPSAYNDGEEDWRLIPKFRLDANNPSWFSWARLGVDDGALYFDMDTPIESGVKEALDKAKKGRDDYLARKAQAKAYDLGPITRSLTPQEKDNFITKLKARGIFSFEPAGFGTAHVFTIIKTPYAVPAAQWISDEVGKPIYYYTQDRD